MNTKKLEKYYGGEKAAIRAIGTYRQQWDYWTVKGIPIWWQRHIQTLTGGKLRPDTSKISRAAKAA